MAVGLIFFLWNQSKSKNASDSSTEEDSDLPPGDENRDDMGYSNYVPPSPTSDISEAEAKKEVLKALDKYAGQLKTSNREIERILLDANAKMNDDDRKLGKVMKWDWEKIIKKLHPKIQKDSFSKSPSQTRFEQALIDQEKYYFFAEWNLVLEHRMNGEIDWKKSLKSVGKYVKWRKKGFFRNKSEAEQAYRNLKEKIEKEANYQLVKHAKEFPNLTNLAELNQWLNIQAQQENLVTLLKYKRYLAARRIGKKTYSVEATPPSEKANFENKKFGLTYKVKVHFVKDKK